MTAATLAFQSALDETEDGGTLIGLAIAGIVTMFCLWWGLLRSRSPAQAGHRESQLSVGYGHYVVFASAAAVGAGLVVAVAYQRELTHGISYVVASMATTVPVAIYLIAVGALRSGSGPAADHPLGDRDRRSAGARGLVRSGAAVRHGGVLALLVVVLTVATRTRAATDEQPAGTR